MKYTFAQLGNLPSSCTFLFFFRVRGKDLLLKFLFQIKRHESLHISHVGNFTSFLYNWEKFVALPLHIEDVANCDNQYADVFPRLSQ